MFFLCVDETTQFVGFLKAAAKNRKGQELNTRGRE